MSLTRDDIEQINTVVLSAVSGLATKDDLDLAKHELRTELVSKGDLAVAVDGLASKRELQHLRRMLEEDGAAEAARITKIGRHADRTQSHLNAHLADGAMHRA